MKAIRDKYSKGKLQKSTLGSYTAERPKLVIRYYLHVQPPDEQYAIEAALFEQEIDDQSTVKKDVFMTLPRIVQAYFLDDYFEIPKTERNFDAKDTANQSKIKNEIRFNFKKPLTMKPGEI